MTSPHPGLANEPSAVQEPPSGPDALAEDIEGKGAPAPGAEQEGPGPVMASAAAALDPAMAATAAEEATTFAAERVVPAAAVSRRAQRFWVMVACHTGVDLYAAFVLALAVALQARLHLSELQLTTLFVINGAVSGFSQPVFAWLTDRLDTRLCGPAGLFIAAAALCSIGYADSFAQLVTLHVVGTVGVGMFHPIGAALTGQLGRGMAMGRSMAVTLFFTAGMVGSVIGPVVATRMNAWFGMDSLVWLILPAAAFAVVVHLASRHVAHRHALVTAKAPETAAERRVRVGAVWTLFTAAVLRFGVNNALFFLLALWCKARITGDATRAASLTGVLFATMSLGMGVAAMAAGRKVRTGHEKGVMVALPLIMAPLIGLMGMVDPAGTSAVWLMGALAFATAAGYASAAPLAISVAQRLMPGSTGMASSLMMGGAWAVSAVFPYLTNWAMGYGGLSAGYWLLAGFLALNGLLSMRLPSRLLRETADG